MGWEGWVGRVICLLVERGLVWTGVDRCETYLIQCIQGISHSNAELRGARSHAKRRNWMKAIAGHGVRNLSK